jgi:hypothetical protein
MKTPLTALSKEHLRRNAGEPQAKTIVCSQIMAERVHKAV